MVSVWMGIRTIPSLHLFFYQLVVLCLIYQTLDVHFQNLSFSSVLAAGLAFCICLKKRIPFPASTMKRFNNGSWQWNGLPAYFPESVIVLLIKYQFPVWTALFWKADLSSEVGVCWEAQGKMCLKWFKKGILYFQVKKTKRSIAFEWLH